MSLLLFLEETKEGKKKENKPFHFPNDHSDGHVLAVQQKHSRGS
jgi:hypothetical protein